MRLRRSNDGDNSADAWKACSPLEIEAAREAEGLAGADAAEALRELATLARSLLDGTAGAAERDAIARLVDQVIGPATADTPGARPGSTS